MSNPLEAGMRQLLLDLEMVSHGRTMSLDGRVAGSTDPSPVLFSDGTPPHEEFRARWRAAKSDERRVEVVKAAREELKRLRRTPPPQQPLLERGSLAWKRDIANDRETSDKDLVRIHSISRQTLWRYRRDYREKVAA